VLVGTYSLVAHRQRFVDLRLPVDVTVRPDETTVISDTYTLEKQAGDVEVRDGFYVNHCDVTLRLRAPGMQKVRLSLAPTFAGVAFTDFAASNGVKDEPFTMPDCGASGTLPDGGKTIFVQFEDTSGNPTTSLTAELVLDRVPPTSLGATVPGAT